MYTFLLNVKNYGKKIIIEKNIDIISVICGFSKMFIHKLVKTIVGNDNTIYFQILFWFIFFSFFYLLDYIYCTIMNKISKTKKYSIFTKKDISIFSIFFILFTCCLIIYKLITYKEPNLIVTIITLLATAIMYYGYLSKHKKI